MTFKTQRYTPVSGGVVASIVAGTGISVDSSDPANPIISSTVDPLTVIQTTGGAVNDTNLDFTFAEKPTVIVQNGISYSENFGWTWAAGTATMANPTGTGGRIYGLV